MCSVCDCYCSKNNLLSCIDHYLKTCKAMAACWYCVCVFGWGCVDVCIVWDCCQWWHLRQFCLTLLLHSHMHSLQLLCWPSEVIGPSSLCLMCGFFAQPLSHIAVIQQNASSSFSFFLKGPQSGSLADRYHWCKPRVSCHVGLQLSVCCTSWLMKTWGGGAHQSCSV